MRMVGLVQRNTSPDGHEGSIVLLNTALVVFMKSPEIARNGHSQSHSHRSDTVPAVHKVQPKLTRPLFAVLLAPGLTAPGWLFS